MFAYSQSGIQAVQGRALAYPVGGSPGKETFRDVLFQATAAQEADASVRTAAEATGAASGRPAPAAGSGVGQVLGSQGGNVDPEDEDAALKELFHLVAMLSLGIVDGAMLDAHESKGTHDAGPARRKVEALKETVRKLLRGGQAEDSGEIDPATGKPKAAQGSSSLSALFQSLPTELQNLLRRAFPNVDELIHQELDQAAKQRQAASPA